MHRFPLAVPKVDMGYDRKALYQIICTYYSDCKRNSLQGTLIVKILRRSTAQNNRDSVRAEVMPVQQAQSCGIETLPHRASYSFIAS